MLGSAHILISTEKPHDVVSPEGSYPVTGSVNFLYELPCDRPFT